MLLKLIISIATNTRLTKNGYLTKFGSGVDGEKVDWERAMQNLPTWDGE
jgi:hypothetical protein